MLTKNFKNMMAMILTSGNSPGLLPLKNVNGGIYYYGNQNNTSSFPYYRVDALTLSAAGTGWSFGTGSTAPTEDDYQLENTITSGLTCSNSYIRDVDSNGNPYVTFAMTVTNTSNAAITISEIGYKQQLYCAATEKGNPNTYQVFLFDRTVLTNPVTIAAGDYAVIEYTLKTIINSGS